jgi:hypothetical protein
MPSTKLLVGKPAIKAAVGTTRDYVADTLVMLGLPVVFINGRWFSSTDAIDTWLKEFFLSNRGRSFDAKPGADLPLDDSADTDADETI